MTFDIHLTPESGKIGDLILITADYGSFSNPFNKNIVTFKGLDVDINARIIKGSESNDMLYVVVPPDAITGDVIVETLVHVVSEAETFTVVYADEKFTETPPFFSKGVINKRVKSFGTSKFNFPIYNKDLSYSNYVEVFDENSLLQNIYTIILTAKGERMFSDFGSRIHEKIFSLYGDGEMLKTEIMTEIVSLVKQYEPRVTVVQENSLIVLDGENVNVILSLLMPSGDVRELGITLKSVNNVEF
jgi:phage baseplate assembly protein W